MLITIICRRCRTKEIVFISSFKNIKSYKPLCSKCKSLGLSLPKEKRKRKKISIEEKLEERLLNPSSRDDPKEIIKTIKEIIIDESKAKGKVLSKGEIEILLEEYIEAFLEKK